MRRGMDDSAHSLDNFFAIFDGAFRLGVAAITVHGRTVRQRYEGTSSREFLREVKQHAGPRTMLGSGDLFPARDCLDMLHETGADGVMVARGAIGNPWIFQQVRALAAGVVLPPPSLHRQREVITEHYRLAEEIYGSSRSCRGQDGRPVLRSPACGDSKDMPLGRRRSPTAGCRRPRETPSEVRRATR